MKNLKNVLVFSVLLLSATSIINAGIVGSAVQGAGNIVKGAAEVATTPATGSVGLKEGTRRIGVGTEQIVTAPVGGVRADQTAVVADEDDFDTEEEEIIIDTDDEYIPEEEETEDIEIEEN